MAHFRGRPRWRRARRRAGPSRTFAGRSPRSRGRRPRRRRRSRRRCAPSPVPTRPPARASRPLFGRHARRALTLSPPPDPRSPHPLAQERAARKRDAKQARKTRAEGAALEGGERACKLCREVRPSAPVGVDARPSSHPRPPISLTAAAAAHAPVVAPRLLPIPPPPRASRSPADPASSRPTPADPSPRVVRSAAAAQGEPRVRGVLRRARRARRPGPRRDRHREIRQGETQGAQRAPRA